MIINVERDPRYSLYYIGAIIINLLKDYKTLSIDELYNAVESITGIKVHINFIYYALDWLYLLSLIEMADDKVVLC